MALIFALGMPTTGNAAAPRQPAPRASDGLPAGLRANVDGLVLSETLLEVSHGIRSPLITWIIQEPRLPWVRSGHGAKRTGWNGEAMRNFGKYSTAPTFLHCIRSSTFFARRYLSKVDQEP